MTKEATQTAPVYTDEHPEYPKLLYNHKDRTTKLAQSKEDEEKLAKQGYEEEGLPPAPAFGNSDVEALKKWLGDAGKALATLNAIVASKPEPAAPPAHEKHDPAHEGAHDKAVKK